LIAILSVQSCSINSHGNLNGQGSSLSITSPNNGESFRTNEEGSVIIGGICEKGTDVDLVTVPERSVTNNCATDGTWSFETGTLSSGDNTFSISVYGLPGTGGSITITADLAASMNVWADTTTISENGIANLHAVFFDKYGAEIVIPEITSPHHITWSSNDPSIASVTTLSTPTSGEKIIVNGVSAGTTTIIATLDSIDNAYNYQGNTTASISITVTSGSAAAPVPGVAASMSITADKTTIDCTASGTCSAKDIANLQLHFFDAFGAVILIPEATTDHLVSLNSANPLVATVAATSTPTSGENAVVTGVANGSASITATLTIDPTYGFTGAPTASITIAVIGNIPIVQPFTDQLERPFMLATDLSGNVYVTDSQAGSDGTDHHNSVIKYDTNGAFIAKWGTYGAGNGQFNCPTGIAVDNAGGFVYVADFKNNRVQKFDTNGNYLAQWGSVSMPIGVAVDSSGNVYVADYGNNRVEKFNSNGMEMGSLYAPPSPFAVAIDPTNDSNVYMTSASQGGVYRENGNPFGGPGASGLAVDYSGNIYSADALGSRGGDVSEYDLNENRITQFGSYGSGPGQFEWPIGTAVDVFGNLYVADFTNANIQKFPTVQPVSTTPTVTGVSPNTMIYQGGWAGMPHITVTGMNLSKPSAVYLKVNGTFYQAIDVNSSSANSLDILLPTSGSSGVNLPVGTYDIVVQTGSHVSAISSADTFTVTPRPVLPKAYFRITPVGFSGTTSDGSDGWAAGTYLINEGDSITFHAGFYDSQGTEIPFNGFSPWSDSGQYTSMVTNDPSTVIVTGINADHNFISDRIVPGVTGGPSGYSSGNNVNSVFAQVGVIPPPCMYPSDGAYYVNVNNGGNDSYGTGSTTCPFATIQAAINAMVAASISSGEVHVAAGTYLVSNPVEVAPGISLRGGYNAANWSDRGYLTSDDRANSTYQTFVQYIGSYDGVYNPPTIDFAHSIGATNGNITSSTLIEGFMIEAKSTSTGMLTAGIEITNGADPTISYNTITGSPLGSSVVFAGGITSVFGGGHIDHNQISGGTAVSLSASMGVGLMMASNVTVDDNTIDGGNSYSGSDGIAAQYATGLLISSNNISGGTSPSPNGIWFVNYTTGVLDSNIITNGAYVDQTCNITTTNNTITP
jgi:DNA-binding beta-propeller fold protein YncE